MHKTRKYSNINANNKQREETFFSVMPKVNKIDTVKTTEKAEIERQVNGAFLGEGKIIINVYRIKM